MLPNGSNAPSLTQDCPAGADKRRWGLADGLCCAGPAARARVGRARVGRARVGRGSTNAGGESPAMTRGRRSASSQARLVADEALHPIRKIQPQLIRCNPPDHVQSSRSRAILPMGCPPSAARARKHNDGRRKRTSRPTPIGGVSAPAPPTPPATMPRTEPRPTRFIL